MFLSIYIWMVPLSSSACFNQVSHQYTYRIVSLDAMVEPFNQLKQLNPHSSLISSYKTFVEDVWTIDWLIDKLLINSDLRVEILFLLLFLALHYLNYNHSFILSLRFHFSSCFRGKNYSKYFCMLRLLVLCLLSSGRSTLSSAIIISLSLLDSFNSWWSSVGAIKGLRCFLDFKF